MVPSPAKLLQHQAEARGFLAAFAPIGLPAETQLRYRAFIENGNHAGMRYLEKNLEERLDPRRRFPWAKSVLVLAAAHAYPDPGVPPGGLRLGRVARYAWVRDYHALIAPQLRALEEVARGAGLETTSEAKGYIDHGPFLERGYGVLAGLGWLGKNSMLMRMDGGSYLTLAVLLTSLELEAGLPEETSGGSSLYPDRCGRCTRCVKGCPTGALSPDGMLDARKCVSYWTIEHRGFIAPELWQGMGEWLLGCDICQEVCPWNSKARQHWQGFEPEAELAHPDIRQFFELSSHAFAKRFQGTVFLRPGRTRMARNALIVLSNLGDENHLSLVRKASSDASPLVRATALHTAIRLGEKSIADKLSTDPDPMVSYQARVALGEDPATAGNGLAG